MERYGDILYRYALRRMRRAEVAEEIVQEALLAALRSAPTFEGRSTEQTWLIGILRRKIVDHIRREVRAAGVSVEAALAAAEQSLSSEFDRRGHWREKLRDWRSPPADLLESREFWATFDRCLDGLPGSLSASFTLRELESLESEEICKILGITPSNLWTQLYRARLLLRRCLEANWFQRKD